MVESDWGTSSRFANRKEKGVKVSELYDVVFYGTDQEGEQLERTKARVAKLLHLDREKLESLFGRQGGVVLRSGVAQDIAQKYQMALTQAGVRCNSRPSKVEAVDKLELVPLEERPVGEQFACPACGYKKKLAAGEPLPTQCEQCGVVPEKYHSTLEEKKERERIKRALIDRHKLSVEEEQRLKEERAAKLRQQRLEEEIRKQLGLPRYLNSRSKFLGSVAAVLLAGVGIGFTSVMVYKGASTDSSYTAGVTESSAFATELEQVMQRLEDSDSGFTDVPGIAAVAQVAALSKELETGNQDGVTGQNRPSSSVVGNDNQSHSVVLNMLGEMRRDREWDQFLTAIVRDLVASRQYADAYRISSQIQGDVQRIDLSGEVAHAFAGADTTNAIIADLKTEAQGLQSRSDRVLVLCRLAVHEAKAGNRAEARQTVQDALAIADTINAPDRKAVATSRIAATWATLGATRQSQESFGQVNTLLASITGTIDRVSAYAAVAQAYVDAGNKGGALRMLQETRQAARYIDDGNQRLRLLGEISVYQAQAGDIDEAIATTANIEPVSSRDAVLFKIVADQLYSGYIYRAMAVAEPIETPIYEARAYALLARYQRGTELGALAQENFGRAIGSVNLLSNDVDKAGILSEIARLRMRTGDAEAARKLFDKALLLVEDSGNARTHDIASALIAKNQTRALQTVQAKKTLSTIADASIAQDVRDDIAQMDGTVDIVKALMPLRTASSD